MPSPRARDASRLSDFDPDELACVERGLVAAAYDVKDGMVTMTVSQSRICDWAALVRVRRPNGGDGMRERLDAWREVHVARGANVIDGLLRVLRAEPG